jgi:peptidoglycan-associated lipoprotein
MNLRSAMLPGLLVVALFAGCAKQPATAVTSTPSPASRVDTPQSGDSATGQARVPTPAPGNPSERPSARMDSATGRQTVPTPARIPPQQFTAVSDLVDVHFDFDKYEIRSDAARMLDANAVWLNAHPKHLLLIEGHCDERGTAEYNVALGERRASAARSYLVAHGVRPGRISMVSYGKERPVCTEKNEDCWAKNRRAHFLVKAE